MKLKSIVMGLFALMLLIPSGDIYSQTRKKTTAAKKTTTAASNKGSYSASAKSASKNTTANSVVLKGDTIHPWNLWGDYRGSLIMEDIKALGNDIGLYMDLTLNSGEEAWSIEGKASCIFAGNDLSGGWWLLDNELNVRMGALKMTLVSTDKGETLKGVLSNDKTTLGNLIFYHLPLGKIEPGEITKLLDPGASRALIKVTSSNDQELLFPCEFNSVPSEDGTGGSFKISIDNALGIGLIKGTYSTNGTEIKFVTNIGDDNRAPYVFKYDKAIYAQLGHKQIDGMGNCEIGLYLLYNGK